MEGRFASNISIREFGVSIICGINDVMSLESDYCIFHSLIYTGVPSKHQHLQYVAITNVLSIAW